MMCIPSNPSNPSNPSFNILRRMLKQPGLISPDLHLSVIKCNCWKYDDNIGLQLKELRFVIFIRHFVFVVTTHFLVTIATAVRRVV